MTHHSSHTLIDISDVSPNHDTTCETCGLYDDNLNAPCAQPLDDFMICQRLRSSMNPVYKAAARRIEYLSSREIIYEAQDHTTMMVEPMMREAESVIFRCVHEMGTIALELLDSIEDSENRNDLIDRYQRALDLQHPVLRHFARIKAIGAASRERVIDRKMWMPPAPIIVDKKTIDG